MTRPARQSGELGDFYDRSSLSSSSLLVILGPVLLAGVVTVALAAFASLFGFQRDEMLITAEVVGAMVLALALPLLYRQIAERKAAHHALQNVEAHAMGIMETAMDAIITLDEDKRIVLFNAAAERVFQWSRKDVLGKPVEILIPERTRGEHRELFDRFDACGISSRRMEDGSFLIGLRRDGTEFPTEASISCLSQDGHTTYTVILRDVSRRVKAEEALARGEARTRAILDSAMDAIITVDENQDIVLFNAAAEDVFRCPREQALGSNLARFIPKRSRDAHQGLLKRFGVMGETARRMGRHRVLSGLRTNGEEFPLDASISQIATHGAKFYTVILRDVTERMRAEEALRQSRAELLELASISHTAREQEKSRIARELHDELGQALTALKMDISWIAQQLPAGKAPLVDKVLSMQELLDSTVAATRRISADLRPLLLDDLGLIAACEWLAKDFTHRNGIACEFASGIAEIELDDMHATAVFRMLQECLTNIARHARASLAEVTIDRASEDVILTVRDNGRGFDASAPRKPGSYGLLGLRERATLLGGRVIITSASRQGTIVEIHIPLPGSAQE
jgi:PAS domain S-box-containing protein